MSLVLSRRAATAVPAFMLQGGKAHRAGVHRLQSTSTADKPKGIWYSAEFWGAAGAIAGWGMTGAAIWDASMAGPELVDLKLTAVMIVYSSLFCRWAFVVQPQNLLLASCHGSNVIAQFNQMRRAVQHKLSEGKDEEVAEMGKKVAVAGAGLATLIAVHKPLQSGIVGLALPGVSDFAGAAAGPFTTHFWAPMSKWLISGKSMLDLTIPTEKISLAGYSALTLTGAFFSRYALLVTPINYTLCSVNIALFGSSAWHLGRKIKADYID